MKNISIIGGGASGLIAALSALQKGAKVTIFEKNDRIGKKLLITGNGHCNLTNQDIEVYHFHGKTPAFAATVIKSFNLDETLAFFQKLGLEFYCDESGRIFPASLQASSVLDVIRFELERLGCIIQCGKAISSIEKKGVFNIKTADNETFQSDSVVLATGGKAAPQTGSDGSGYKIAEAFGHTVLPVNPGLTQLKLTGNLYRVMEGIKWESRVSIYSDNELIESVPGDIIFTNYGISGLAILKISRSAVLELLKSKTVEIELDLLPDLDIEKTVQIIKKRVQYHPEMNLEHFFTGWINKRYGQAILKLLGYSLSMPTGNLSLSDINKIAAILHAFRFGVSGHTGWQNAQITAGGINADEIDPNTLESKIVKNLYFAGELIDIDGDSGGYNLQWAWSSGYTAGASASG
jgi:predicted Rossmann fold flavoprotein